MKFTAQQFHLTSNKFDFINKVNWIFKRNNWILLFHFICAFLNFSGYLLRCVKSGFGDITNVNSAQIFCYFHSRCHFRKSTFESYIEVSYVERSNIQSVFRKWWHDQRSWTLIRSLSVLFRTSTHEHQIRNWRNERLHGKLSRYWNFQRRRKVLRRMS